MQAPHSGLGVIIKQILSLFYIFGSKGNPACQI